MIDIPIEEMVEQPSSLSSTPAVHSNNNIYLSGHSAQIEYQNGNTMILCSIYGPHLCTKFFLKDNKKWVVDVKCKFPASSRNDPDENDLQYHVNRILQTWLKDKNYPGWIITVVIDIWSIHKSSSISTLLSDCVNSSIFWFNKAGIALKLNGLSITYGIDDNNWLTQSPNETEITESSWVFTLVVNPFDGEDGIIEMITHKGYLDVNILTTKSFIDSLNSVWKKYIKELKSHKDLMIN